MAERREEREGGDEERTIKRMDGWGKRGICERVRGPELAGE